MDYEKEYKKLKADISNAYLYAQTDSTKAVLENILPELRESEDERIRKALISVLKSDFENDTTIHDISVGDIIAWLEKQKDYIKLPNSAYTSNKSAIDLADTYTPKNKTPLIYSHFDHTKRVELRGKLELIFNELGIDNVMGIRDFILAEMVDNFLTVTYNTKKATEELGYNNVVGG